MPKAAKEMAVMFSYESQVRPRRVGTDRFGNRLVRGPVVERVFHRDALMNDRKPIIETALWALMMTLPRDCKIRTGRRTAVRMLKFAAKNQLGYFWSPYPSENVKLVDWLYKYYHRSTCGCEHCESNAAAWKFHKQRVKDFYVERDAELEAQREAQREAEKLKVPSVQEEEEKWKEQWRVYEAGREPVTEDQLIENRFPNFKERYEARELAARVAEEKRVKEAWEKLKLKDHEWCEREQKKRKEEEERDRLIKKMMEELSF